MLKLHLHMFDTQVTTQESLSVEMKTFYEKALITFAEPHLVHDQFGQKVPIPKNGGKTIEFRKYSPLAKAMTPLTEGVTPAGNSLNVAKVTSTVAQYGDFIQMSDMLLLTAIDNNMVQATELLGAQAGRTLDAVTREVINAGTNVMYAGNKTQRSQLTTTGCQLTVDDIRKAKKILKSMNAETFDGKYVAIVSPDTIFDLQSDSKWIEAAKYAGSTQLFNGEVGEIYGVRFVETTEAKTFTGASSAVIQSTLVIGKNAYGVTEITGGGLEHIVKQLGSSGTADPLNQRATVGWKATKTAEILVDPYMVRIESCTASPSAAWETAIITEARQNKPVVG